MKSDKKLIVVAGVGQGLGVDLVLFFLDKNCQVIGLNRSASQLQHKCYKEYLVDLCDEAAIDKIKHNISSEYGVPDVLIHNTQKLVIETIESTSFAQFEACWRAISLSAFSLSKAFLPAMAQRGQGTMIVSGATASLRGGAKFSAFSSAKFALRGLTQSLARSYQHQGLHIVHVVLDGIVNTAKSRELHNMNNESMMSAYDIAEVYWQLIQQPKSTWTHELDLRPATESF